MIKASEIFEGTWPFRPNFFDGNGFLMHYVDEGPIQANSIILSFSGSRPEVSVSNTSFLIKDYLGFHLSLSITILV